MSHSCWQLACASACSAQAVAFRAGPSPHPMHAVEGPNHALTPHPRATRLHGRGLLACMHGPCASAATHTDPRPVVSRPHLDHVKWVVEHRPYTRSSKPRDRRLPGAQNSAVAILQTSNKVPFPRIESRERAHSHKWKRTYRWRREGLRPCPSCPAHQASPSPTS